MLWDLCRTSRGHLVNCICCFCCSIVCTEWIKSTSFYMVFLCFAIYAVGRKQDKGLINVSDRQGVCGVQNVLPLPLLILLPSAVHRVSKGGDWLSLWLRDVSGASHFPKLTSSHSIKEEAKASDKWAKDRKKPLKWFPCGEEPCHVLFQAPFLTL